MKTAKSLPSPPSIASLPKPPARTSLPLPPKITSSSMPPATVSSPAPPSKTLMPLVPAITSLPSRPSTVSSPSVSTSWSSPDVPTIRFGLLPLPVPGLSVLGLVTLDAATALSSNCRVSTFLTTSTPSGPETRIEPSTSFSSV